MWFGTARHYPQTGPEMKGFMIGASTVSKAVSPNQRAAAAAVLSLVAVALGVVVLALAQDTSRLPEGGVAVAYIGVALAWGFVGVGAFAWLRRPDHRTGRLMIAVGLAVLTAGLQFSDAALPFLLGALVDALIVALLVHLLLAFPTGRLQDGAARVVVAAGYVMATVLHVPQLLLGSGYGCEEDCPSNPIEVADAPDAVDAFALLETVVELGVIVAATVLLVRRRRGASRAERRGLDPVLLLGAVIVALGGISLVLESKAAQLAFLSAFALLPAAFLLGLARSRVFRTAAVGRLIAGLTADSSPASVRDALRAALGDPALEVGYWLPEDERYVDGDGGPLAADGRAVTEIGSGDRRVGALVHAPALRDDPELLREAASAAALAIENGRLEAELRARLEALRASRARIVEAGDAERRRLTRDLHDGAQQRLVSLQIDLQLARERWEEQPAAARELVERAIGNAEAAVGELRELAAGIHPAVLAQRGLDAAVEALATRAPLPVEFETQLGGRPPSAVETAAYFVVAEALTNVAKYAERDPRAGRRPARGRRARGRGPRRRGGRRGARRRQWAARARRPRRRARRHARGREPRRAAGTLVRARVPLRSAAEEGEHG